MKETEVTKMLLENQKNFLEAQTKNIEVLTEMKDALVALNDTNVLHVGKEDERYAVIKQLSVAVEARAKVMNLIFLLLAVAIVILAGAEKALTFLKLTL
jgi:hypothetical protein